MPHEPAYHYSPDEKPDHWWKKEDGSWLGFWTREWPDLLGAEVLKQTRSYGWEVWQPDCRADKVYSKRLKTGVIHKLFPARVRLYGSALWARKEIYSEEIIKYLAELAGRHIILQLHGFPSQLNVEILSTFGATGKFPIFLVTHGTVVAPVKELFGLHRPLTYLRLLIQQRDYYRTLQYVDVIAGQNQTSIDNIQMIYSGRIEKLQMGCDFRFWIPVPSQEVKNKVRVGLNISDSRVVFLATGNFVPLKQFDKLIEAFKNLSGRDNFVLVIAGHGDRYNTNYLHSLASELILQNKVIIHPYATGELLRDLYWASDVYVSVSRSEGSSVAVMKAMACGLPLLSTPSGETSEMMKKYGAGRFVPVKDYDKWTHAILEILDKRVPKAVDIDVARDFYDWPNVAKRFINIYHDLSERYYN